MNYELGIMKQVNFIFALIPYSSILIYNVNYVNSQMAFACSNYIFVSIFKFRSRLFNRARSQTGANYN
jgi:hypothetical protein